MSARKEFLAGLSAGLPILLGVIPFGLIYGVLALGADLSVAQAQGMSSIVFAGSAQFVAAQMLRDGAPASVMLLTAAVINLRHMLYSASVAPYLQPLGWRWKALLAYLLTDEAFAVAITRYAAPETAASSHTHRRWYYLGAGLALWTVWQISTAIGIALGAQVPASWGLDFALPLTFIALVVPALRDRPAVGAALTAGLVAVAAHGLPFKLGLVTAAICGIAAGLWLEHMRERRSGGAR